MIRKGEIVGMITNPSKFFDKPSSKESWAEYEKAANAVGAVVRVQLEAEHERKVHEKHSDYKARDCRLCYPELEKEEEEAEDYGPKTAAMPDPEDYDSGKLRELIDVGSLPDGLKEKAWKMLEKRVGAFGFDGRLGHHPAKVHIRTLDGQVPIAVPMYGSSPAKHLVIDEQLDKWFEQGVIEPSISPWSAPVVIAYRNGKPRFCVDYRKLNAVTIGDEFPIPRQTEILAAVSGAQVLSSLDALAGFTQLEFEDEDIEKTAFRTHRGLFQFRRMPFGLKKWSIDIPTSDARHIIPLLVDILPSIHRRHRHIFEVVRGAHHSLGPGAQSHRRRRNNAQPKKVSPLLRFHSATGPQSV
jgi:hypothetical protein